MNAREGESCEPNGFICGTTYARRCDSQDWATWWACCGVWVLGAGNDPNPPRSCDEVRRIRCPDPRLPGLCDVDGSVDADGAMNADSATDSSGVDGGVDAGDATDAVGSADSAMDVASD